MRRAMISVNTNGISVWPLELFSASWMEFTPAPTKTGANSL